MTGPNDGTQGALPAGDELRRNLEQLKDDLQKQQDYDNEREELLQEQTDSWDSRAKRSASDDEKKAAEIVRRIREHERDNLFGNKASELIPGPKTRDMGGQFLTNMDRIHESHLFKITARMPKGAHLHQHFNSELPVTLLLERARNMEDNMYIRSTQPLLQEEDYYKAEIVFNVLPADTPEADPFASSYNPEWKSGQNNPWMKWKTFRNEFAQRRNGGDAEPWVKGKMILGEDEVYGKEQTVNGIWARFNQATRCFKGLLNYKSVYQWYIKAAIEAMIDDGVMYAELRPMLMDKSIPSDDGKEKIDLSNQMRIITEAVKEKMDELARDGKSHVFPFGIKIIYCTPRSIPKAKMISELEDCIKLKQEFPKLICGFDLVGAEDRPNSIGFYRDELMAFTKTCERLGIEIPFMFHAGETLLDTGGSKDPKKSNLYESVLLKAKRVGHGFALTKHPRLIKAFKDNNICIELCPVSNELLHLCRNVKEHPFPELLAAGIPCTVNADNITLFGARMSHEFYQVMVGTPTMSLHGWRQLAEWSLEYSCLNDADQEKGLEYFHEAWENFCRWVVEEYSEYAAGLDINE
ncbi:uncharacterized protein K452DRAFT_235853 [Aplosporella prunicola CBS 121167]|uniref:adenosine deaminase n=1 Tax=Aplosporella prunicola CBS 121167 TaxID=1176127 RepID=A0A6A6B423_9PEZI|nr:uncharacterized protein K452DRAFT_235853 [Aplosporella prunicola CBS 121167]KAF2137491.1 hypothetical protein K452DRAFT_235853 [Aplosporella prunicola CBS 121167]